MKYVPAWFPGAKFQRRASEARTLGRRVVDGAFNVAKEQAVSDHNITTSHILTHHPGFSSLLKKPIR